MDRRKFLTGVSAAACMSAAGPVVRNAFAADNVLAVGNVNRVAVVGAGIVGASIAYNLSKRGCDVILLDKAGPAAQASGNSFAWINATYFDMPRSYFTLRSHSLNEYHRLAQDVDIPIHWGGSLEWYDSAEREKEVSDGVQRIQEYGAPTWLVSKQRVKELEPNLDTGSDRMVAWSSREGAVHPGDTTHALVNRTLDYGGSAVFPATVSAIRTSLTGWLV